MGELVIRFRKERGIHGKVKVTFAGRLDPLAYGEVILLTHADVYLKEKFTKKSKEYIVTLLFGLKTDTDDLLGVYNSESNIGIDLLEKNATLNLIETLLEFKGEHEWEFHPFSSKTIKGKALFQISKEGGLLTLPVRTMNIYDIHTVNPYVIKGKEVLENIQKAVHSVQGDFRQDLIRASLVSKRESIIESDFFFSHLERF